MVRRFVAITTLSAALLASPALAVGKPGNISWGKPNVTYATYNADAQQCANRAFGVKVGMKTSTAEALGAIQFAAFYSFFDSQNFYANRNSEAGNMMAVDAVRPDRVPFRTTLYKGMFDHAAWVDIVEQLQQVVDSCLVERGYQKFRLTDAQRNRLNRLRMGTAEREHYLHNLGSNPEVLASQRI
ncbi:hypothetical protein [Sphingomonas crusticola]|uniref:hypothetical protein n=1 Tax=Sphingomonas crusticola TaxID=1697973 RepID=UPI0013C34EED|nr:hypothetical protein [Sphingomonas crusticola]